MLHSKSDINLCSNSNNRKIKSKKQKILENKQSSKYPNDKINSSFKMCPPLAKYENNEL